MNSVKNLVIVYCTFLFFGCNSRNVTFSESKIHTEVQDSVYKELVFDNDTISIYKIDSMTFFENRKSAPKLTSDTLLYISDFEKVKEILKGRVIFGGYNEEERLIDSSINDEMIFKIIFSNGKEVFANGQQYFWDMGFVRFYPTEDILLCEGGHTSDFSFDLKNGIIGPDSVGNPEYINKSPSGKYRLNGWFPGQECSDYFLQLKTNKGYQILTRIPMDLTKLGFDLCTIVDEFWLDDYTLFFRNYFFGSSDDTRLGFYRLEIKK